MLFAVTPFPVRFRRPQFWVALWLLILGGASSQASPVPLGPDALNFNDPLRSPYALMPITFSQNDYGELTPTKSGIYRLDARDADVQMDGGSQALKIPVGKGKNYWIAFRKLWPETDVPVGGAMVYWTRDGENTAQLLDTTPGSLDGVDDAALQLGVTFADRAANVFITPLRFIGTDSIEVAVTLGASPTNRPPALDIPTPTLKGKPGEALTFKAQATDPDGDPLAFFWDFGDQEGSGGAAPDAATVTHTWEDTSDYTVRCTVSDLKGGTASRSFVVRLERQTVLADNDTRRRVIGRVTLDGAPGTPVADALVRLERVVNGNTRTGRPPTVTTYTDSDGTYVLANILSGQYVVKVKKPGYNVAPIATPDKLEPDKLTIDRKDISDVNFAATPAKP